MQTFITKRLVYFVLCTRAFLVVAYATTIVLKRSKKENRALDLFRITLSMILFQPKVEF